MGHGLLGAPEKAETGFLVLCEYDRDQATVIPIYSVASARIGEFSNPNDSSWAE